MPKPRHTYRNIDIALTPEAVQEAMALWITKYHGIEVNHKQVRVSSDSEGRVSVSITKQAKKPQTDDKTVARTDQASGRAV